MTYEKKSVIELREIAKERKIKGISTLKKKELIEVLENYDQEQSKQQEDRIKIAIDAGHQKKQMSEKEAIGPGSDKTKPMVSSGTEGIVTKRTEYQEFGSFVKAKKCIDRERI